MSRHKNLHKFLVEQSPTWLADRLLRAAERDRALLAELQTAVAGVDGVEVVRRELDRAIFVSGFVDEDEVATYVAGIDRGIGAARRAY